MHVLFYQPKLPKALQGAVKVKEGAPTQSVDNQEEIQKLFPNTYGMPIVEIESVCSAACDGAIILLHDTFPETVEAALEIIDRLHQEGYYFVTVEELLRLNGVEPQAGVCYYSAGQWK